MTFRWPWAKALTATPTALDATRDQSFTPYPLLGGGSRQRILDAFNTAQSATYAWTYQRSPAVRTVVDVIVRNVGQLDLRLYEEVSESERQPMPDHPAALSLRYPSDTTTQDGFVREMFKDFLLYDNAYALLVPSGKQLSMFRMPAHMVEIRGASMFEAEGYRFWRRDGTFVDFTPDQVMHWCGENPDDPRMGISRIETLRSVIAEDVALQQATVELANSGMQEPTWVFRPLDAPEWSNPARKGFEEDLTARVARRNRAPVVLEEGMELRSFGVTPHDAEMLDVRKWAIGQIASIYGVPYGMVGLDDKLEEARSQFYSDTLPPYCEEFTRMLNLRILVRVYNSTDLCFEFNLDEKHMGDDRLAALVSATGRAVMTTNEGRAKLNLPPIDTGDELVTPLNVLVGNNPKPSPMVMPPQQPGQPAQDGSARNDQQPPKALVKAEEFEPLPQLVPSRKQDLDIQHRAIDRAAAVILRHYQRLERSVRAKAEPDWTRWDRELSRDLHRLLDDVVDAEGTRYAFKLGGDFQMRLVRNYLRAMADGAAEGINQMIAGELNDLGVDGAFANRDTHVQSAGAGFGAGAVRWAREEAARQSPDGEHRVKIWIADTNRHAEFNGDTVPIGADWPAGFAPGTAPGCRCSMTIQ